MYIYIAYSNVSLYRPKYSYLLKRMNRYEECLTKIDG